jgi:serine/threonine protein kinase
MLSRRLAASEEEAARPVRHPGDLIRVTAGALIWVRTPELVAISALPDGSGVLVTRLIHGESLGQSGHALGDDQLKDTWEQVARLHAARIAHRDLRRANIVIDDDGRPWIVDFGFAEAAASDRLLAQDAAELLVSLALVVGVGRAVASACGARSSDICGLLMPGMRISPPDESVERRPEQLAKEDHRLDVMCPSG